jgi:hypothetical protein
MLQLQGLFWFQRQLFFLLLIAVFLVSGSVLYVLFEKNQIEVREYRLVNMADTLMIAIAHHPDHFLEIY